MRLTISTLLLLFFVCVFQSDLKAQDATLSGVVRDSAGNPVEAVSVSVVGESGGTITDAKGKYLLRIQPYRDVEVAFSSIGYATQKLQLRLNPGENRNYDLTIRSTATNLGTIQVKGDKRSDLTSIRIEPKTIEQLPSISGNFEDVVKTFQGVVSNNELSSSYSVRGGNYDENLVYVNDIEIYRPFLVRSGQQEGLSFINSDLVDGIQFSAGGFSAMYGDKLSSVLDIKYRRPEATAGSAYVSLLGAGFHLESSSKNDRFTWLCGFRQKSNQFVLKSMDTKGDYKPSFTDLQTLLSYKLSKKTEVSVLASYARNNYRVIPSTRETEFGNINEALKFTVYFDGQEVDNYKTSQGAISLNHQLNERVKLKLIGSAFTTREQEFYDVVGQYFLDELEKDLGSSSFGEVAFNRGVGGFLDHARNELEATVMAAEHKGVYTGDQFNLLWGVKMQHEGIHDELDQWQYRDSADFSVPHSVDFPGDTIRSYIGQQLVVNNLVKNKIDLSSERMSGYLQSSFDYHQFTFTAGIRATYWNFNEDFNFSPRVSVSYKPERYKRLSFRAAAGLYFQPPFYRELRDLEGQINDQVTAQRSLHLVLGSDYQFLAWGREFKLSSEAYYKKLDDLIPYKLDNTRIRYLAKNNASGYAAGLDFRVNGEFVSGIESWASLSIMKTEEDLSDDVYYTYYNSEGKEIIQGYTFNDIPVDSVIHYPGSIPRPSDQRVTFSMFFQDYLPHFPSYRMHMTMVFGTGLPYGPPGTNRYTDILRGPTYRRVDIGFSKIIIDEDKPNKSRLVLVKHLSSLIASMEVFNLLQVSNTVSYTWITDVTGRKYGVPNYLSSRLLNIKLQAKF